MVQDNTPVLIGAGMTVQKEKDLEKVKSPLGLLSEAAQNALADAGATPRSHRYNGRYPFVTDSPEGRNAAIR